jgi:hypothetical protein
MDFSAFRQRYVALHLMYLGAGYQGLARQADSENTIEVCVCVGGGGVSIQHQQGRGA